MIQYSGGSYRAMPGTSRSGTGCMVARPLSNYLASAYPPHGTIHLGDSFTPTSFYDRLGDQVRLPRIVLKHQLCPDKATTGSSRRLVGRGRGQDAGPQTGGVYISARFSQ
ncbi:hypothetical protein FALCPG4_014509 [Fusarium falciforme]